MNNGYSLVGIVEVTVTNADGSVESKKVYNKITNYAKKSLAKWLSGSPNTGTGAVLPPTVIAAGNGTPPYGVTGPLATDTALWSEMTGTRKSCDQIMVTQAYYAQYNLAYQMSDPEGYYNELGLFDANGNLWAHVAIDQYKSASQTLTIQWMVYMIADTSNSFAVVTNFMRTAFASWMSGVSNVSGQVGAVPPPTRIQVGTGTGRVSSADTALWNPIPSLERACQTIQVVSSYNVLFALTYASIDPSGTYTEMGWVDGSGNLWFHAGINAVKQAGYIMSIVGQVGIVGN
ncbi:hypothetical protein [Paenibacillus hexagrammi]|uniref:Phage protein n=1 Tax=Paenibacillus hexagrammi TaxID=2908839 RepID=A0ABY3SU88_9BACL|nr:hypothetical protein [Paenibacillus sp. YPD9-1]UJF36625.1 hypothetical protein L0M14_30515 [Paenibacillus sp. YPD9-1]